MRLLTKTNQRLEKTVEKLQEEVTMLRSVVIGMIGEDNEGEYRPEFVKEMLEAAKEPAEFEYVGPGSLLAQLDKI